MEASSSRLYFDPTFGSSPTAAVAPVTPSYSSSALQNAVSYGYGAAMAPSTCSSSPASLANASYNARDDGSSHRSSPEPSAYLHGEPSTSALQAFIQDGGRAAGLERPLTVQEQDRLVNLEQLNKFLAEAPSSWSSTNGVSPPTMYHPSLRRFPLPNQEHVTCVLWGGLYHITGTDIVRALVFRFEAFGRPVRNMKKFEEGVFSDLRNLKPGVDACLEEPKSPFLDLLFKHQCIRTQKKQKVFYWFSVPHGRLFLDALERDLKREKMGLEPTTMVTGEPARSFKYDPKRSLYDQYLKASVSHAGTPQDSDDAASTSDAEHRVSADDKPGKDDKPASVSPNPAFRGMFALFEGSSSYKTRRRRQPKTRRSSPEAGASQGYRPVDDHQIRPSIGHNLGLQLTAGDAFLAQTNPAPRYLPALDPAPVERSSAAALSQPLRAEPHRGYTFPSYPAASSSYSDSTATSPTQTVRAYSCPLYSCGRLFKRMEHLKRHVRTHTLERPYPCQRCSKRFARADNLQQHLRIHARADALGRPAQEPTDDDDAELQDLCSNGNVVEVEFRGDLPEEGLTPPLALAQPQQSAGDQYYGYASTSGYSQEWSQGSATAGSPSYTHVSASSPSPYSAPSQQTSFDNGSLLPPQHDLYGISGPGPIRRHRSATPGGDAIRRPATAFHPYAHAAGFSSTRSSPATYTVGLEYAQSPIGQAHQYPRAETAPSFEVYGSEYSATSQGAPATGLGFNAPTYSQSQSSSQASYFEGSHSSYFEAPIVL